MLDILPDAVLLRAAWMYMTCPGTACRSAVTSLMNLLTAAMRQETLRFSMGLPRHHLCAGGRGQLTQAMELPGGVYNFGSENDCDMVTTARRACALLDIHPRRRGGRLAAQPA